MTTDTLRITGGATPRTGTLQANGAPEAALPMLAAAAALKRPVTLSPVPATTAIQAMTTLIEACGWAVTRTGRRVRVVPGNFHDGYPAADLGAAATLPGSRYLAVPLLAAYGRTQLPWPCDAPGSEHPMDLIFKVLEHFGDTATAHEHGYRIEAGQGPHTVARDHHGPAARRHPAGDHGSDLQRRPLTHHHSRTRRLARRRAPRPDQHRDRQHHP